MTINVTSPTNSAATTAASTQAAATGAAGGLQGTQDEFLKLFMAQLQQQDPLNPSSGTDMVAQLAQFSSVEQATQTNTYLQQLTAAQASTSNANLATLVGRQCDVNVGGIHMEPTGSPPPIDLSATGSMKGASIVVTDSNGNEVQRIAIPDGASSVSWNGNNKNGVRVPQGDYTVSIDQGTSTASITAQWHGEVDSVEMTANGARLRMGGILVTPADISSIGADLASTIAATAATAIPTTTSTSNQATTQGVTL